MGSGKCIGLRSGEELAEVEGIWGCLDKGIVLDLMSTDMEKSTADKLLQPIFWLIACLHSADSLTYHNWADVERH